MRNDPPDAEVDFWTDRSFEFSFDPSLTGEAELVGLTKIIASLPSAWLAHLRGTCSSACRTLMGAAGRPFKGLPSPAPVAG